jgi:hypothetical protein
MALFNKNWKNLLDNTLLIVAIVLAILLHGSSLISTLPKTYDAYVHIFFADHYARNWFETWEYRWYTGFSVTSYPPLLHQLTALLSMVIGLKVAFFIITLIAIIILVVGVYRFSKLWVSDKSAQYAALLSVITPSIVESIHVFGQIPTIIGIGLLLNALPDVYSWIRGLGKFYFFSSLSLLVVVAATHHVTIIFGQIFFILPIIAVAIFDRCNFKELLWEKSTLLNYWAEVLICKWRIISFFIVLILSVVLVIFPYWYLSKYDPIAQISIPHGSRDNFLLKKSSGAVFFVLLWGMLLPLFVYALKRSLSHRNVFLFFPFILLFILGTGGTTPIPKWILGENAFNILTLDRFTFWATILSLPFAGEFIYQLLHCNWGESIVKQYGMLAKRFFIGYIVFFFLIETIILVNLGNWNVIQPETIDIKPIVNFLSRDEHFRWRYLTLGFGDQMAWLSANTDALCIDGNYHSARRLPELTTRAIERLENAKFKGTEGIGSLQQFLTVPEKYNLKYVFSNDKFYDPLLYYAGWQRVQRLENGIMVWEKQDISKIPPQVPATIIPQYQKLMWGIFPITSLIIAILFLFFGDRIFKDKYIKSIDITTEIIKTSMFEYSIRFWKLQNLTILIIPLLMSLFISSSWITAFFSKNQPEKVVLQYYDYLDRKLFNNIHELFIKDKSLSLEQYLLEISVEDGVLMSFAKLDAIETRIIAKTDSTIEVEAKTTWITPLEEYNRTYNHFLQKKDNQWLIKPKDFDLSIPPDESFRRSLVMFFNQGKRRVSTAATNLEDVIDRPELNIVDARLVKLNDRYSVVGQVLNNDNYPAHLTITAILFDSTGQKITEYNVQHYTHHKILPKEVTPFRIDFEDIEWKKNPNKHISLLKPGAFLPYVFERKPTSCVVFARAVSEDKDFFKNADLQSLYINEYYNGQKIKKVLKGKIINSGVDEITIPQLIIAYYNNNNQIEWVDKLFLPYGVRPQRKIDFEYTIANIDSLLTTIYILKDKDKYTNGLLNSTFLNEDVKKGPNIPEDSKMYINSKTYIQTTVNSFISNPTIY